MNAHESETQLDCVYRAFLVLCEAGLITTAVQLIDETWQIQQHADSEETTARIRSLLMRLTCDLDGTAFTHWDRAFEDDRNAFLKRATDVAVMLHHKLAI